MWHKDSNEDQERRHDRTCADDHEPVLLDLLPGSLLGSGRKLRQGGSGERRDGHFVEDLIFVWLPHQSGISIVTVSVGATHFALPVTGATNAIGARTGRSTSSD